MFHKRPKPHVLDVARRVLNGRAKHEHLHVSDLLKMTENFTMMLSRPVPASKTLAKSCCYRRPNCSGIGCFVLLQPSTECKHKKYCFLEHFQRMETLFFYRAPEQMQPLAISLPCWRKCPPLMPYNMSTNATQQKFHMTKSTNVQEFHPSLFPLLKLGLGFFNNFRTKNPRVRSPTRQKEKYRSN